MVAGIRCVRGGESEQPREIVHLDIEANSFLYRMVRSIAGTALQVGRGQLSVAQFASLFDAADRSQAGPTAPPHGLCLMVVNYSGNLADREAGRSIRKRENVCR